MKILVTGAGGFIGKNLTAELKNRGFDEVWEYDINTGRPMLFKYARDCDFVFHLAGVNRPKEESEFMEGNCGFTGELIRALVENNNPAPILVSSSIQAELSNPYGESKRAGEELLFRYAEEYGAEVFVYRLPNVFGKWCRPDYNSVVATFCNNIARSMPIRINDGETVLKLVYIDDVVNEFIGRMEAFEKSLSSGDRTARNEQGSASGRTFYGIPVTYSIKLSGLAECIEGFKASRSSLMIPDFKDELTKKLYSTYLSYLPEDDFSYALDMHKDQRGSFTEFIKTGTSGQVSVNVVKPGITKGEHWHHSKNEKFLVVSGQGLFQFRKYGEERIIEYRVSGEELKVLDIPTGYVHNIINEGKEDMVVIIWANEVFDPARPDTYYEKVLRE